MPRVSQVRPNAVAIYIRWSTDEQTEGTTLETQKERCSLYVRSQGWEVTEELIFIDDGYSGGSLDRPSMAKLRKAIKEGRIDCVVSYSLDRLSRSVADTVQLVQHEWLGKCIYRSASQPISTEEGNPTGQLIFNILASFAEFERALIRERTHSGLVRRAKQGKYPGTKVPPYGYKRDGKGHLVINSVAPDGSMQGPAAVIERIYELATLGPQGQGPTAVARALMSEGLPSPTGGPWWSHQVRSILQNPVYCGDLVYGRRRVNPAHKRDKTEPERLYHQAPLVTVQGAIPAIVQRSVWEKAQQLFRKRSASGGQWAAQAKNRSLLAGVARCRCGGPLSVFYDRRKNRYYRCSRNFLSAGGCPHEPGVLPAGEIEVAVVEAVMRKYGTAGLRQAAASGAAEARTLQAKVELLEQGLADLNAKLRAVEADVARLLRSARRGEITPRLLEELRKDAEAERAELQLRHQELSRRLEEARSRLSDTAAWAASLERIDLWDSLGTMAQREILGGLFREIIIYKPKGSQEAPVIDLVWEGET